MIPDANPQAAGLRRKILVVDDNAIIVRTLSFKLKAAGYDVRIATDEAEAVSTVRKDRPHLVLLDISFPANVGGGVTWDGFQVMDWLRRIDEAKNIPIFVITAGEPAQHEKRALEAGATAFFHKPIDHTALINAIRKTLGETTPPPPPVSDQTFSI